jgi:uncharacterized protein (DUF302 family)
VGRQLVDRKAKIVIYEETVILQGDFGEILARVKEAFAAEGFGTLTEIDLQATLAEKVGKKMDPYVIVGACNPHLASRAIDAEPLMGVLLPCNVTVRQLDNGVSVEAMDPGLMASVTGNPDVAPIAEDARELVNNALARLQA